MKVFLLEDDPSIKKEITYYFEKDKKHSVINVIKDLDVFEYIIKDVFDMYILNLNTKFIDVFEVIFYIRKNDKLTPIIIINGSTELESLKKAYEHGCNEYLKQPFLLYELDIKVKQLSKEQPEPKNIYFEQDFFYNKNTKQFYHNDYPIDMPLQEQKFCNLLFKNLNTTVKYANIIEHIWGYDSDREEYPIRQLVKRTRDSLPYNIIKVNSKIGYIMVKRDKISYE